MLLAPIGLLGVVRAARESRPATYAAAVLALAIGLSPYAYLFVADGPASWGKVASLSDLVAFFLREEYGGATSFIPGAALPWTASLAACLTTIGRAWLWLFAIAGIAMLATRIWRPSALSRPWAPSGSSDPSRSSQLSAESRWASALLAASFLLAGPLLATRFNVAPEGIGLYVVQRFHLLPALLLTIPVAAALDPWCARLARPRLVIALACAGFVALSLTALPHLARIHSPAMERGVANLLGSLPPHAIAVVISEDQCFAGHYLQLARGQRPDVALICSELLGRDWYRATWASRGLSMPADPGAPLGDALVRTGRPIFVDRGLTGILTAFPSYPFGVVYRVLPRGAALPSPHEIAVINRELYRAFDLDYPRPGRGDDFAAVAHRRYTAAWAAIANLLEAAGDPDGARAAIELARQLQPVQD